jgi:hypothetical protein
MGWRNSFLGIDSGAPYTFKNTGSVFFTILVLWTLTTPNVVFLVVKENLGILILQAYRTLVPGQAVLQGPNGGGWRPQNSGLAEFSYLV